MDLIENELRKERIRKIRREQNANLEREVTLEMLYKGRAVISEIIRLYGNKFLPYYVRIEDEIKKKKKEQENTENALHHAKDYSYYLELEVNKRNPKRDS